MREKEQTKNKRRATRAAQALKTYAQHSQDDDRTLLVDLLVDLKHWATQHIPDVDLWQIDDTAREHFNAEVQGIDD